ncbi:hypothetical protein X743_33385 [Mesorhizobium sp. LNHC252B00]|nr:hypothetical protein X743_33385 [Mesorhizobium sp. LNHC252B00]
MLNGGEDVFSRQRLEVLAGVVMAEPIQKAAAAQKNAFAGLRLQAPHPAQIVRKEGQKRSIGVRVPAPTLPRCAEYQ